MATVLHALKADDCRALLPETLTLPIRDWYWAEGLAELLLGIRETLSNAPARLDFASISRHPDNLEPERWEDLALIEQRYRERLQEMSLEDACDQRHAVASKPGFPDSWQHIWLAATPAPAPALLRALGSLPDGGQQRVSILVAAPGNLRLGFNAWGCPKTEFWRRRNIEWENFDEQVLRVSSPNVMMDKVAELLNSRTKARQQTTIGVLSSDLTLALERAVKCARAEPYNPEGKPQTCSEPGLLLRLFRELLAGDEMRAVTNLLRLPFFLKAIAPEISVSTVLRLFDRLCEKHLPDTLRDMHEFLDTSDSPDAPLLAHVLGVLNAWRQHFREDWAAALRKLLGVVSPGISPVAHEARENILHELSVLEPLSRQHARPAEDWLALVLRRLAGERTTAARRPGAVPLLGWLELLWVDAPQLILAGLNEGNVPENISADPFLSGKMREKLGLTSNAERFATAAYTLQAMLAQRRGGNGQLFAFVPQCDTRGNSLSPSRLLFLAENTVLPGRVRLLFAEPEAPSPPPPWQAGWMFSPEVNASRLAGLAGHMRATQFRDYLDCPFRFFIRHVAGMVPFDAWKMEPDPRETGGFLHTVLEAFARDTVLRESTDADAIARFAQARLEALLEKQYGARWPLPVSIWAEAARMRLTAFASCQGEWRKAGWQIRHVEVPFQELLGKPFCLDLEGPEISGKIDRLDFHEELGWCVLDYKTSAKAANPEEAHLAFLRKNASWPPEFAHVAPEPAKVRSRRWVDLQLPLYRYVAGLALGASFKQTRLAYFNVPQIASEAGVQEWVDYSRELEDAMLGCARGVQRAIAHGCFWPPNPHPQYDDLEELLALHPESVIDPRASALLSGTSFVS
jgi:ATP-dependent helicase/nuclease subunit B